MTSTLIPAPRLTQDDWDMLVERSLTGPSVWHEPVPEADVIDYYERIWIRSTYNCNELRALLARREPEFAAALDRMVNDFPPAVTRPGGGTGR